MHFFPVALQNFDFPALSEYSFVKLGWSWECLGRNGTNYSEIKLFGRASFGNANNLTYEENISYSVSTHHHPAM